MIQKQNSKSSAAKLHWDLWTAVLLLATLVATAMRLVVTRWVDSLYVTLNLGFLGILAGLALGRSRFRRFPVAIFATVYSLFAVVFQLTNTLEPEPGATSLELLTNLADRLMIGTIQLARQQPVEDPLFFLFLMAALFWLMALYGGYAIARHGHVWRSIIPPGLTLLVIQTSDSLKEGRVWFMGAFLFFALSLVARQTYLHQRARWRENRSHTPQYVDLDLSRAMLIITATLVLISWSIPSIAAALPEVAEAWREATEPWWGTVRERAENAFSSLRGTARVETYVGYYGTTLELDRGSLHSDTAVMTVDTPPPSYLIPRYYWRARVYDQYDNGLWTSSLTTTLAITPTESELVFPSTDIEGREQGAFSFTPAVRLLTLYVAPQPLWVSRPGRAQLAENPDGSQDLGALTAIPPLDIDDTYHVVASLSTVTVAQLREAGVDYPQWVIDRYLQLPESLPTRIRDLAQEIAGDEETPFDAAVAITRYLRQISYAETIPSPPRNQDPIDWFLFDQQEGFCNYYASAHVVMLRSLGIPARLAAGFAQGQRLSGGSFQVLYSDSHGWPEVYFPGLGWVEFEPTAAESELLRPLGATQPSTLTNSSPITPTGRDRLSLEELLAMEEEQGSDPMVEQEPNWSWVLYLALAVLAIGASLFVWRKRREAKWPPFPILMVRGIRRVGLRPPASLRRWARRSALPQMERAYQEINLALVRLGAPADPADTPGERTATLIRLLPSAAGPARRLLDEYHDATFGTGSGDIYTAQGAAHVVRIFSTRAMIRRLFMFWKRKAQAV